MTVRHYTVNITETLKDKSKEVNSKTWYPCLEIHTNNVLCPGCRSIWCHIERCCSEKYRSVSNMMLLIEFYKDY